MKKNKGYNFSKHLTQFNATASDKIITGKLRLRLAPGEEPIVYGQTGRLVDIETVPMTAIHRAVMAVHGVTQPSLTGANSWASAFRPRTPGEKGSFTDVGALGLMSSHNPNVGFVRQHVYGMSVKRVATGMENDAQ